MFKRLNSALDLKVFINHNQTKHQVTKNQPALNLTMKESLS